MSLTSDNIFLDKSALSQGLFFDTLQKLDSLLFKSEYKIGDRSIFFR